MSVVMDDGYEVSADACIAAVPHDALLNLLPREMSEGNGSLAGLRNIKTSPITGVHLWYDRTVMTEPFLTLLDHTTQWVFNKTLLYKTAETDGANVASNWAERTVFGSGCGRPVSPTRNQRVLRPRAAVAPGNHRSVPPRTCRSFARHARSAAAQSYRDQGNQCDVFARARSGPLAPSAEDAR